MYVKRLWCKWSSSNLACQTGGGKIFGWEMYSLEWLKQGVRQNAFLVSGCSALFLPKNERDQEVPWLREGNCPEAGALGQLSSRGPCKKSLTTWVFVIVRCYQKAFLGKMYYETPRISFTTRVAILAVFLKTKGKFNENLSSSSKTTTQLLW